MAEECQEEAASEMDRVKEYYRKEMAGERLHVTRGSAETETWRHFPLGNFPEGNRASEVSNYPPHLSNVYLIIEAY